MTRWELFLVLVSAVRVLTSSAASLVSGSALLTEAAGARGEKMHRRELILGLAGAAICPVAAQTQPPAGPVIGVIRADTPAAGAHVVTAFRKGLSEAGFVEGRNVSIELRWAEDHRDRLAGLAADLVRRKVAVIVAPGSAAGARAAKAATTTIPIVFSTSGDPVELGLVDSLSRPGGNVTGFTDMASELVPKALGLLHQLLPSAVRFGVLVTRTFPWVDRVTKDGQSAAAALGGQVQILIAGTDREINAAFASFVQQQGQVLLVTDDVVLAGHQAQILERAARSGLPAIYLTRAWVDAGGLMSYGPVPDDQARQAGLIAGRILKGEKPSDLPVMRPTKFEFVINLKTAKALGLTVPPILIAQADEIIE